jgi:hypothetical protein
MSTILLLEEKRTHSVLVPRSIDTMYPRDLEIPFVLRVCEWSDESTRGGIDVDGYRDPRFGFVLVEFVRHSLDGLENSSVGRSKDTAINSDRRSPGDSHEDTNSVLINILHSLLGVHYIIALFISPAHAR